MTLSESRPCAPGRGVALAPPGRANGTGRRHRDRHARAEVLLPRPARAARPRGRGERPAGPPGRRLAQRGRRAPLPAGRRRGGARASRGRRRTRRVHRRPARRAAGAVDCWPPSAASIRVPGRWPWCATTRTPPCSTAGPGRPLGLPVAARRAAPAVDFLEALDGAGFNHVAAPLVRWTWEGATSDSSRSRWPTVRGVGPGPDLAARPLRLGRSPRGGRGRLRSRGHALGTMTARMHLALDRAFDRHPEPVGLGRRRRGGDRRGGPRAARGPGDGRPDQGAAGRRRRLPVIRTHGDFHLGRTSRTDQGWVVSDCLPGGVLPGGPRCRPRLPPGRRGRPAVVAAPGQPGGGGERDPAGRLGLAPLGQAWETRNRRAVLNGYLNTPGISRADRARPRRGAQSGGVLRAGPLGAGGLSGA
jgi:hypothetical protein